MLKCSCMLVLPIIIEFLNHNNLMCEYVCIHVCTYHGTCVEVRGQPELILSFYHVFPGIEFRSSGLVVSPIP